MTVCCAWPIVSLVWTIMASFYKIPSKKRKLWTGHGIYPPIDSEWASATLTLEVRVWLLRMTHRLIITNICAKLFQTPLINDKVMDRTWMYDGRRDRRTEPISISPFFIRKGGDNKILAIMPFRENKSCFLFCRIQRREATLYKMLYRTVEIYRDRNFNENISK
jgi:hypothetical protein